MKKIFKILGLVIVLIIVVILVGIGIHMYKKKNTENKLNQRVHRIFKHKVGKKKKKKHSYI